MHIVTTTARSASPTARLAARSARTTLPYLLPQLSSPAEGVPSVDTAPERFAARLSGACVAPEGEDDVVVVAVVAVGLAVLEVVEVEVVVGLDAVEELEPPS